MKSIKLLILLITSMAFVSCSDDEEPAPKPKGDYESGYFVTNEGPFQNGSGTITFVGDDGDVQQEVYKIVNGENLGNIVNSMYIDGEKGYIVVNNSSLIVVVDRNTMEKLGVIEGNGINNPRHFIVAEGKGFVSNWGDPNDPSDDFIAVVDLDINEVRATIPVGEGPEHMLATPQGLLVALEGGFNFNDQVLMIDPSSNQVIETIEVGDVPNSMQADGSGNVWVLCAGKPFYADVETPGTLHKIQLSDTSTSFQEFDLNTDHPSLLNFDAGQLYYHLNGQVFRMSPGATEFPSEGLPELDGFYYSMTVANGELYGTDAGDFASEGTIKVFNANSGALLNTLAAGIIPGQVVIP
ncbi:MAG: DUF5074 domain-containing protein [Lutimonas sp.]